MLHRNQVVQKLISILEDKLDRAQDKEQHNFDDTQWAYKQAYLLGGNKRLKEILELLDKIK